MPDSFADTLDKLDSVIFELQRSAKSRVNIPIKPSFTRAVLQATPVSLIRDAKPWESRLFARIPPPPSKNALFLDASGTAPTTIGPAPLGVPTPLKKKANRNRVQAPGIEPEQYAQAGIAVLDDYESIRSMPRAREMFISIIDQCAVERDLIAQMEAKRTEEQDRTPEDTDDDLAQLIKEEEARLKAVQQEVEQLRKRRDLLLKRKAASQPPAKGPKARPPPPSADEAAFWDSPEPAANARHRVGQSQPATSTNLLADVSSLLDTSADFSVRGPSSPTPGRQPAPVTSETKVESKAPPAAKPVFDLARLTARKSVVVDEFDDEPTVMLKKPPLSFAPPPPTKAPAAAPVDMSSRHVESVPLLPANEPAIMQENLDEAEQEEQEQEEDMRHDGNIHLDGNVLSIFDKMWSTIGDTILPRRRSDPPDGPATLAHLEALATNSPSTLSYTPPSEVQTSTATLIISLLRAPAHTLPLEEVKATAGTKVLYACIGKKLIWIERGGGAQNVKFTS